MLHRFVLAGALFLTLAGCGGSQFGMPQGPLHRWYGPPARFRPTGGWYERTSGRAPVSGEMSSVTVAGTVRWRGVLELAPPNRTLRALRARDGIEIYVELDAESDFPPSRRSTSLVLGSVGPTFFGEGPAIQGLGTESGRFVVGGNYDVSVAIFYGRRHPSPRQRAEAHAEVMRLVLPRWPHPNAADG